MHELVDKMKPHVDKITESLKQIGFSLGCLVWHVFGLDELVEAVNDGEW